VLIRCMASPAAAADDNSVGTHGGVVETLRFQWDLCRKYLRRAIHRGAGLPRRWYPRASLTNVARLISGAHWTAIEPMDRLMLGNIHAAYSSELFVDAHYRVSHVVNATDEIPNYFEHSSLHVKYLKLGWFDDSVQSVTPAEYRVAYEFIDTALQSSPHARVLVHCQAGHSRSASVVLYWICRSRSWSIEEGMRWLAQRRWTSINETFLACVAKTLAEDFPQWASSSTSGYATSRLKDEFELHV
jgi:protein-tyrosine phosphatase